MIISTFCWKLITPVNPCDLKEVIGADQADQLARGHVAVGPHQLHRAPAHAHRTHTRNRGSRHVGDEVAVGDSGEESLVVVVGTENGLLSGDVEIRTGTDINNDGIVSTSDIMSFMLAWRQKNTLYDFNGDNAMTFKDFGIILADAFNK